MKKSSATENQAGPFKARCGLMRCYSTSREAVAYERGWQEWPSVPWGLPVSPRMSGYLDRREHEQNVTLARRAGEIA